MIVASVGGARPPTPHAASFKALPAVGYPINTVHSGGGSGDGGDLHLKAVHLYALRLQFDEPGHLHFERLKTPKSPQKAHDFRLGGGKNPGSRNV